MNEQQNRAAIEEITAAVREAVESGHYSIAIFHMVGGNAVCWSKTADFPEGAVAPCVEEYRRRVLKDQAVILRMGVIPEDPEIRIAHFGVPMAYSPIEPIPAPPPKR